MNNPRYSSFIYQRPPWSCCIYKFPVNRAIHLCITRFQHNHLTTIYNTLELYVLELAIIIMKLYIEYILKLEHCPIAISPVTYRQSKWYLAWLSWDDGAPKPRCSTSEWKPTNVHINCKYVIYIGILENLKVYFYSPLLLHIYTIYILDRMTFDIYILYIYIHIYIYIYINIYIYIYNIYQHAV